MQLRRLSIRPVIISWISLKVLQKVRHSTMSSHFGNDNSCSHAFLITMPNLSEPGRFLIGPNCIAVSSGFPVWFGRLFRVFAFSIGKQRRYDVVCSLQLIFFDMFRSYESLYCRDFFLT